MMRLPHDLERLPALFDERADPDFREVFGLLSRRSTWLDVAVTRIRLTTLDLRPAEIASVRRLRLLLTEVNAMTLDAEAHALLAGGDEGETLRHLASLLERKVIEVRAAPLGGWSPDFTVFGSRRGPQAVLLGFHWFQRPYPHRGPALASVHGPRSALLAAQRFDGVWAQAHDIRAAIMGILRRAGGVGAEAHAPTEAHPWTADPGSGAGSSPRERGDSTEGPTPERVHGTARPPREREEDDGTEGPKRESEEGGGAEAPRDTRWGPPSVPPGVRRVRVPVPNGVDGGEPPNPEGPPAAGRPSLGP